MAKWCAHTKTHEAQFSAVTMTEYAGMEAHEVKRCRCVADIVEEAGRILFHEQDCIHSKDAEFYFRGESLNFARKNEGKALPLGTAFL